jgi:protein required for attachment to host cells
MKIDRDAWIVLADGRKALIAQNVGTPLEPKLAVRNVLEAEPNPATHEQGTDRPGRSYDSSGSRRASFSQTDWHEQAEQEFAKRVAGELENLSRTNALERLVVVAAPRSLAQLRSSLSPALKDRTIGEIDKDLTNHPVAEVEKILAAL